MKVYRVTVRGKTYQVEVGDLSVSPVEVRVDGEVFLAEIPTEASTTQGPPFAFNTATSPAAFLGASVSSRTLRAPMPGKILAVRVGVGSQVHRGDEVCVLEAMKMEQVVRSTEEGVIRAVLIGEGQMVAYGDALVELG
ncbi:MAG: acetyl-CoA carboxylase biotin carboxyl carrier protein subunit [Chloroflexi bacterium]|nr:acetyl-CoA carboxylase biotin carboxyl carrier protein subunit [Chloroflexota bacterium]